MLKKQLNLLRIITITAFISAKTAFITSVNELKSVNAVLADSTVKAAICSQIVAFPFTYSRNSAQ